MTMTRQIKERVSKSHEGPAKTGQSNIDFNNAAKIKTKKGKGCCG